jgi:uncharacterized membrane protein YgdD (TMEM256/DUF423 family)
MQRLWIGVGALMGCGAVLMAALAAHVLAGAGAAEAAMLGSALQMQAWHALALVAVGLWAGGRGGGWADAAGAAFAAGALLFCGAVYLRALAGVGLGAVAPLGGTLLMAGWLLFAISALRAR